MYYLIETKDKCYKIVDNITDIRTKGCAVYKYCMERNIQIRDKLEEIRLSGVYCIPIDDFSYAIYAAENDGWIYRGKTKFQYELKFVHYVVTDGNKYQLNNSVKQHKLRTIQISDDRPKA